MAYPLFPMAVLFTLLWVLSITGFIVTAKRSLSQFTEPSGLFGWTIAANLTGWTMCLHWAVVAIFAIIDYIKA